MKHLNMTVKRLTPADYLTSRWSGGTTTELLIRPRGAVYAQRTFLWRVSSATVELEKSTFTALPDYDRRIATLQGEITLMHDGGEPVALGPYQVHAFDGGSETVSWGRCRDFNLMLRKGKAAGSLTALTAGPDPISLSLGSADSCVLLYCAEGRCTVNLAGEAFALGPEESLLLEDPGSRTLTLRGVARLMLARMGALPAGAR